jgi:hypothetical protein
VNQEYKAAWGEWLLAHESEQGPGWLHSGDGDENGTHDTYCCLGGLCEVTMALAPGVITRTYDAMTRTFAYAAEGETPSREYLPASVTRLAGLPVPNPSVSTEDGWLEPLGSLNDCGRTFPEIWALIDAQL